MSKTAIIEIVFVYFYWFVAFYGLALQAYMVPTKRSTGQRRRGECQHYVFEVEGTVGQGPIPSFVKRSQVLYE